MATRVAIVTAALIASGVETVTLDLCRFLRRAGYAVEVLTTEDQGAWFSRFADEGIPTEHIPGYYAPFSSPRAHIRRVAQRLVAGRYDVLLLNHSRTAVAALPLLPDSMAVVPLFHSVLAVWFDYYAGNPDAWNAAIAISPRVQQVFHGYFPDRHCTCIPNGHTPPPRREFLARPPLNPRDIELLYLGRLTDVDKGIFSLPAMLAACLAQGLPVRLTIAGDGVDRAALEQKCREAGVMEQVTWLGQVSPAEVTPLLLRCPLLLFPSTPIEGLGMVLLEAQACGCVPIASRLPGVTDFAVRDGHTGILCTQGAVAEFAAAVAALAAQPARWAAMSQAARALVEDNFTVEQMGTRYAAAIDEIVRGEFPLRRPRAELVKYHPSTCYKSEYLPIWLWRGMPGVVKTAYAAYLARTSHR